MAFVGNMIWFVFGGGVIAALEWIVLGSFFACTIVGYPFAVASFRIAGFAALPFGKELVDARILAEERRKGTGFINVLWVILAGFWLSLTHVCFGLFYCATIIGIPFGLAHFKLARVCFAPLGKRPVRTVLAVEAEKRDARAELDRRFSAKGE